MPIEASKSAKKKDKGEGPPPPEVRGSLIQIRPAPKGPHVFPRSRLRSPTRPPLPSSPTTRTRTGEPGLKPP